MRPERKRPDQGQSGWVPITLLSVALHLTAIVSIPEAPPPAPVKPAPIQFELVPPTPSASPAPEPSPAASATPPSPPPEPKPSPAEKPPEPEKKAEEKPKPEPRPSVAAPPKPPSPPPPPPPPPPPMMGRKVRLGPALETPPQEPSGKAPPPPVLAKAPKEAKPGVPDEGRKDGGSPEKKKLKSPIKVAPAPPVANRAKPKAAPKKLATRKGARDGVERASEKPKLRKGAPRQGARAPMTALEELAEPGGVQDEAPKPARRPVEVEKPEPDEEEGDKDGEKIELAKEAPPAPGADGEVPEGKDPAADEEGFIPLTEALRRRGGGASPNIVPNWISSNMSQDGDVGLDEYKAALLAQIQRSKVYPAGWDPSSWAGAAQVAGTVDGFTGRLLSVWLTQSSGRRDIDRAALQTIVRASPFPPIGTAGVLRFQIAIRYGPDQHASSSP